MPGARWIALFLALTLSPPAYADLFDLRQGDVICVGYDRKSHSCQSISIPRGSRDSIYTVSQLNQLAFRGGVILQTLQVRYRKEHEPYCVVEHGIDIVLSPGDAPMAESLRS